MSSVKETPMSRAHSLTNKATHLMNTTAGTGNKSDTVVLQQAFDAFQQGADLFEQASKNIKDHGALAAVNLLIIQNRKQMKDITRRLNTLKIQDRQRQMNLEKAQALKHPPRSPGFAKKATEIVDNQKQPFTATESRTNRHSARDVREDTGPASPNASLNDVDKRPRRRRVNPATSMMGSSMFESGTTGQRDSVSRSPLHPIPRPLMGAPVSSLHKTSSSADRTPVAEARERIGSISRSPENRYSTSMMGDKVVAPSTSASSVYDGSLYTSGYGHSQTSRSSGSSTFGAFDGVEDSFVYFTHPLGSSDPFARFWNMLETAMDQISNPVAFASMPIDLPQVIDPIHETLGKKHRRKHKDKGVKGKHAPTDPAHKHKDRDREHGKDPASSKAKSSEPLSESSSADSFCVISRDNLRDDSSVHSGKSSTANTSRRQSVTPLQTSGQIGAANRVTNGKTSEELALENTNLRRSLDTLSLRSQALERELETYRRHSEQRQEMMKSVVLGVRREAQKAIIQNQILGSMCLDSGEKEHDRSGTSSTKLGSPLRHTAGLHDGDKSSSHQRIQTPLVSADEDPFAMDNDPEDDSGETVKDTPASTIQDQSDATCDVAILRRRIQEVEAENQVLKIENQRSRSHLQKYRDRFERMKVSSRAKKEAKLSTGGMQRASELPTLGEEGE